MRVAVAVVTQDQALRVGLVVTVAAAQELLLTELEQLLVQLTQAAVVAAQTEQVAQRVLAVQAS